MINVLKAVGDETRLRMLSIPFKRDLCVCEIEGCLELTQSNASRHLNVLKKAGVLESYKQAQWTYYKISERFKVEHQELYSYLKNQVKRTSLYTKDIQSLEICPSETMCGKSNP